MKALQKEGIAPGGGRHENRFFSIQVESDRDGNE